MKSYRWAGSITVSFSVFIYLSQIERILASDLLNREYNVIVEHCEGAENA